jgi:prophage regulatory protein
VGFFSPEINPAHHVWVFFRQKKESIMAVQYRTIIKRKQVEAITGLSRSTIYAKLDPKSKQHDPDFPKALSLGAQSVGWYSDEIQNWIDTRPLANAA